MSLNSSPNLFIPIALAIFISLLLIGQDVERAFADVEITVITPTGGALSSASDCSGIGAQNHIIWMDCNDVLYAINEDTDAVLANITVATTGAVVFATVSGTSVLHVDTTGNIIRKYSYSDTPAPVITLTGTLTPASCDLLGRDSFQYDATGFVWVACNGLEDKIIKFSPETMTITRNSQDLGVDCGSISKVAYWPADNIGVIACATPTVRIVTFSQTTTTTVTILDSEIEALIASEAIMIDGNFDRIIAVDGTDLQYYVYTAGGIMSAVGSISGNAYDQCVNEPFITNGASDFFTNILCLDDAGASVTITAFSSNSSGVTQVLNTNAVMADAQEIGLRFADNQAPNTILVPIWYINADLNDQKYVKITGLRDVGSGGDEPTPPDGGEPTIIGGVDCSLAENAQKVICRIGGDGTIGGAGAYIVGDGSEGTGLSGILCSLGFVDCSVNDDVKTNGIGYLLFIAGVGIMVGLFFMISRGDLSSIPTFIWIIGILALAGAFALFNIIDPVVFIISIVAVIALAVPKIISTVRGDNTMGGGNSA